MSITFKPEITNRICNVFENNVGWRGKKNSQFDFCIKILVDFLKLSIIFSTYILGKDTYSLSSLYVYRISAALEYMHVQFYVERLFNTLKYVKIVLIENCLRINLFILTCKIGFMNSLRKLVQVQIKSSFWFNRVATEVKKKSSLIFPWFPWVFFFRFPWFSSLIIYGWPNFSETFWFFSYLSKNTFQNFVCNCATYSTNLTWTF